MTGIGRGKAILLGEHAVVYGHPALAVGLPRGARAEVEPSDVDTLVVEAWDLSVQADASSEEPLARAFHALLRSFAEPRAPLRVSLDVEVPAGAGLGGSAACGVAVARALCERLDVSLDDASIADRALTWERVFHGTPSGIDTAISAAGGVGLFRRSEGLSPVLLGAPLHLVVIDSGERSSTKVMVEGLAARRADDLEVVSAAFARIETLVREGARAVSAGDLDALGRCMTENHTVLARLGLSTPQLDAIVESALAAGALGAKLTGSGGGGCAIALARDAAQAESLCASLAEPGRYVERFEVAP
jgi:mevalonate kinase